jgi:hypothetical protein
MNCPTNARFHSDSDIAAARSWSQTAFSRPHQRASPRRGRNETFTRSDCSVWNKSGRVRRRAGMSSGRRSDASPELCRQTGHSRSAGSAACHHAEPGSSVATRCRIGPRRRWCDLTHHADLPQLLIACAGIRAADAGGEPAIAKPDLMVALLASSMCFRGTLPPFRAFGKLCALVWQMTPDTK